MSDSAERERERERKGNGREGESRVSSYVYGLLFLGYHGVVVKVPYCY